MSKLYYTCEEVAKRYRVKLITVWSWCRKGKIAAIKVGREYRITEESLKDFERNNMRISAH